MNWSSRAMAAAVLLAAVGSSRADGFAVSALDPGPLLSVAWDLSRPAGSLRGFADATSARGAQFELRYAFRRHLSIGLASSWLWLAQNRPAGALAFPDATVAGPAYHRVQFLTLRGTADWYLASGAVQPYLGLGLGGAWHGADQEIATLGVRSSGYALTGDPHAGLLVTLRPGLALHFQARMQLARGGVAGAKTANWLSGSAGLALY
jgi:hypothetical protein